MSYKRIATIGGCFVFAVVVILVAWELVFVPLWLTRIHKAELADAIVAFEDITWSREACFDPTLLEDVAVGAELEAQQSFLNKAHICYVFEQPGVQVIKVSEYSSSCAKVIAENWHLHQYQINLDTLEVVTGTEYTDTTPNLVNKTVYILLRKDNDAKWKVTYRQTLSKYMRTHEWFEIPNCSSVPTTYLTH